MASNHKNIIELNGKLYDTKSGVQLSDKVRSVPNNQLHQTIDGFIAPKPQTIISPNKDEHLNPKILKPIKYRQTGGNTTRRKPEKSSILMRKAVKKPAKNNKIPEISLFNSKNRSHIQSDRANHTGKSPYIHKFGTISHQLTKRSEVIKVVNPPEHKITPKIGKSSQAVKPITRSIAKSDKLFDEALKKMKSPPKQKHKLQKRKKTLRWGSGVIASLLLIGFVVYLNLPNINVKLAGAQAGFSANMPKYKPSGYSFKGTVSQEAGKITINFKSNTDDRSYSLKQEVSNWNSQSLQENFLISKAKNFTASQEKGRTIFIYDNGNATWVNGGVWYQIESKSLSSEQLLGIASSI